MIRESPRMRSLKFSLLCLVVLCAGALPAAAAPSVDGAMMAPVQRWIAAFNDAKTPLPEDVFTTDAVITDQFAPYVWSGTAGVHAWSQWLNASLQSARVKKQHVVTGAPQAVMIAKRNDRAAFVLPATLTYEVDGKPGTDRALWLFVVVKSGNRWKIAADTWTRTD
jgi:hypothetical protein